MSPATTLDIEDRLAVIVGQLNALHAELVDLVAEARDTDAWSGLGIRSLTHWLTWKAGVTNERASALVRLAAAKSTHPELSTLFADGRLTVDQAAVAVKVEPRHEHRVAEMAPLATVNQLRTIVRCSLPAVPPPPDPELPAVPEPTDSVSTWTGDDGRYHLRADLSADHGRIVDAALRAADRLRHDAPGLRITWIDASLDVAERSIGAETPARRERFRINLFLDPTAPVPATWPDGTTLPDLIRNHLTCDGLLSPVFTTDAHPTAVGRTQRIVPERLRRLVLHRDHPCRVPWCGARNDLDVHHIIHWLLGGHTDYENLVALCRHCHRAHHHGLLGISGNPLEPDGLVFTDRLGRVVTGRPRRVLAGPHAHPYEHALGERMETPASAPCSTIHRSTPRPRRARPDRPEVSAPRTGDHLRHVIDVHAGPGPDRCARAGHRPARRDGRRVPRERARLLLQPGDFTRLAIGVNDLLLGLALGISIRVTRLRTHVSPGPASGCWRSPSSSCRRWIRWAGRSRRSRRPASTVHGPNRRTARRARAPRRRPTGRRRPRSGSPA